MIEDAGLLGSKASDADHVRVLHATLRQDLASFEGEGQ